MNPLGLVEAVLVLQEGFAHPLTPKRLKEQKRSERGFLIFYFTFLPLGAAAVGWAIRSIYPAR